MSVRYIQVSDGEGGFTLVEAPAQAPKPKKSGQAKPKKDDPIQHGKDFGEAKLAAYATRIEHLEDKIDAIDEDIASVFVEAKALGFDTRALRQVIRRRAQDQTAIKASEALRDLYLTKLESITKGAQA